MLNIQKIRFFIKIFMITKCIQYLYTHIYMYPIIFIKKFRKKFKSMHLYYNIYNLNQWNWILFECELVWLLRKRNFNSKKKKKRLKVLRLKTAYCLPTVNIRQIENVLLKTYRNFVKKKKINLTLYYTTLILFDIPDKMKRLP